MEVVFLLGAVGCVSEYTPLLEFCARLFHLLARSLGSALYYKKTLRRAKHKLSLSSVPQPDDNKVRDEFSLENVTKEAEFMIAESKIMSIRKYAPPPEVCDSKKGEDRVGGELRSYWMGLDVKVKRDFMKVSVERVRRFVKGVHKSKGVDVLKHVMAIAREHKKWRVWVCRTKCDKVCFSAEECRTHLEEKHAANLEKDVVMRIGINWAYKIQHGRWEPVDTVAAVEMIKTQLEDVKAFTTRSRKKGWSDQWPLATADEERSDLLKEVKLLLVSLCEHQILSCSIRDWVMSFPVKHLRKLEVSEESIKDCRIVETPQSICFLERDELKQIRGFLKKIKCERHDGTDHVGRAVDSLLDRIRIKESIEFDEKFSLLFLDKSLLKSNNALSDDDDYEGKIKLIKDPDVHYAKAQAQGDDIISWLGDHSSVDKSFPGPIREHNLVIWVAVLRALQYTCKTLGTKYAKKEHVLEYEAALLVVENLCDERRKTVQEDQWNSYASLLCDRFEDRVHENPLTAKLFLCAVRDVFEGGLHLTFDIPDLEDCMNLIRERSKSLSNDKVLKSIELLKSMVTEKVLLIDAKILLTDNSRIRLLDKLTRLSAYDNRSYMLYFLKPFLLNEIVIMKSKVKSDAAEADLLLKEGKKSLKEEKKSQAKKTRKDKNIKKKSTSVVTPVDKIVEHESSVKLEPEEHSKEPERGGFETSSNTDIQVEATAVDCNDSLSKHLEPALEGAAARYNSALDMTLKNEIVNMEFKAKSDAAEADLHGQQITSTSMASPGFTLSKTFSYMSSKPSVDLQPAKTMEEDSMETKDTLGSEKGPLETSSNNDIQEEANKVNSGDMQNMPGEDSVSGNLESALGGAATRYNSALDMTLKALVNINVLKEQVVKYNKQPVPDNLGEQVLCALQSLFTSVVSEEIKTEGVYTLILRDLLVSLEEVDSMSSGAAEVLVPILEYWHCWKNSERDSLVDRLFTLEENERMSCRKCGRSPNYPEQSSYGIVVASDSIRNCAFGDIKFVDILKVTRMEYKMLCDIKTGGCGTTNFVHHVISRCPPIFIIVLEWEKSETEKEISETTKALEWEIDISRLYEGLEPNTNYRLVSMVGYGDEDEEHICMAYEKNQWVNLRRESLAGEVVGNNWKNVVTFCGERKVRPVILLYEAV
ncbi:unnamed protein product [Brassica rapa subsp. narinosa]